MDIFNIVKKTKEESTPVRGWQNPPELLFLTVATAIFQYKKYPSRDDYVTVARQTVHKYPFLGSKRFGASQSDEHTQQAIVACVSTIVNLIFTTYSFGMYYWGWLPKHILFMPVLCTLIIVQYASEKCSYKFILQGLSPFVVSSWQKFNLR